MAQKTKIGGTAYTITHGRAKIGGTTYDIGAGKTKIGGTAKDIVFGTVPYKYQQVAYVEASSDGPYIVLPITTQEGLRLEFECMQVEGSSRTETCRMGFSASNNRKQYFTGYKTTSTILSYYGRIYIGSKTATAESQPLFRRVSGSYEMVNVVVNFGNYGTTNTASVKVEDDSASVSISSAISFAGNPFYLYSYSTSSARAGIFGRVTAYNGSGAVIMDLYPVKRKSDNVPGFWDTVSKQFLTNAGSGSFSVGANV